MSNGRVFHPVSGSAVKVRQKVLIPVGDNDVVGTFYSFDGLPDDSDHFAVGFAVDRMPDPCLVRLHSECVTGDVFGSRRCDCGPQLNEAVERLAREGGYLLYLRQEGRGIGLKAKLDAYQLQQEGFDTFQANRKLGFRADMRDYGLGAAMLRALGAYRINLLTNNPDKVSQLRAHGIDVQRQVETSVFVNEHNRDYLTRKKIAAHHSIQLD